MPILKRLPMSKKIVAVLTANVAADMHVGLTTIPRWQDTSTNPPRYVNHAVPYFIVYPLTAGLSGPPFGAGRHDDVEWLYQVSAYSERGDQLEWMRDKALEVFLGKAPDGTWLHDLAVPGMKIMERNLAEDSGIGESAGGIIPSDLRFSLLVTPAGA